MRKKLITVLALLMMLLLTSGCIKSDVTIKENMSGTWKTKAYIDKKTMADFEEKMKAQGITNYTIKESTEKVNKKDMTEYKETSGTEGVEFKTMPVQEIVSDFKNKEELDKIINCLDISLGNTARKTPTHGFKKNEQTGKMTMDLSNIEMIETTFHVEGTIDKDTTKGTLINDSTIKFSSKQPVIFTYKPVAPILPKLPEVANLSNTPGVSNSVTGIVIIILLIIGIIVYYKKRKTKESSRHSSS